MCQSRLAPDARLVAEDEGADWSDRLQEGEDVVPRPQGGLVVSGECQERSRNATECPLTDPRRQGGSGGHPGRPRPKYKKNVQNEWFIVHYLKT